MDRKVAIIIGATGYLGNNLSRFLITKDLNIILIYRNNTSKIKELENFARKNSKKIYSYSIDVLNEEELLELAQYIYNKFNRIDILINSIGKFSLKNLYEYNLKEFNEIISNNLLTVFLTCKTFIPFMRKNRYGRVINFAYSNAEHLYSRIKTTPYAISKAGVIALSRSFAKIEAKNNITINVISPGIFENKDWSIRIKRKIPAKRTGNIEEILNIIDFLISEKSSYITGSNIIVSGGLHI